MKQVTIFYHLYIINDEWYRWVREFFEYVKQSSYEAHIKVHINMQSKSKKIDLTTIRQKIKNEYGQYIVNISSNQNNFRYEGNTLQMLYDWCADKDDNHIVCYIHSKGASRPITDRVHFPDIGRYDWRNMMLYFCITKMEVCVSALRDHDAVGCRLADKPMLHFSGNYWLANSNYIKRLQQPLDESRYKYRYIRLGCEFWIGNNTVLSDGSVSTGPRALKCIHYPAVKSMKAGYNKKNYR